MHSLRGPHLPLGRVAATLAVVVLLGLLIFPRAAAGIAPKTSGLKFTPPFAGATVLNNSTSRRGGCGSSFTAWRSDAFNLATGRPRFNDTVSVTACGNKPGFESHRATLGLSNLSFTVPTSGRYVVIAHWDIAFYFRLDTSTNSTTGSGPHWSEYTVGSTLAILDRTTGATANWTGVFSVFNRSGNWSGSSGGYGPTGHGGIPLNSSHRYLLTTLVFIEIDAQVGSSVAAGVGQTAWLSTQGGTVLRGITIR
jgi:hypothetical protein